MGKLIDIDDIFGEKVIMVSQNAYDEVMKLMRMIREAPEVDAVPVVRCKNCKWFEDDRFCGLMWISAEEDGFCSMGKRREDNG